MKVRIENGKVIAEAESVSDTTALLAFTKRVPAVSKTPYHFTGKTRTKTCRECGVKYRYKKAHAKHCTAVVALHRIP